MSLGKRINNFFKKLGNLKEMVSPSSFYEARKKIDPELYKYLNSSCVQQYYKKGSEYVKTWRGRLLWAVDCTTINLPDTEETRAFYTK
ncbi:hypothetical protein [Candidatus Uabimicrobium amorphum]|uniref:Uncharacterized protein n=1 Tax=Uabimicrobium amorphum TaxID=2596890 RepID=A0A5S9IQX9_UABAM|nr:hypothetical protein [Candidatus Uabimicrobium amorphum]BBM85045.1 hypothetical protein UABAM_03408 [Candidatus Uabimicrobium amorphum]